MQKVILIFMLLCFYGMSNAASPSFNFKLTPYIGADIGIQKLRFKPGYGDNLFEAELPFSNLFFGLKLNDYMGIEGGYESTLQRKKTTTLLYGAQNLGLTLTANSAKYISKDKIYGWHIGVAGEYPLYNNTKINNTSSIIWYAGIKNTTTKLIRNRIQLNYNDSYDYILLNQNYKKNIAKIAIGVKNFINKHFATRVLITWEQTSKINPFSIYTSTSTITAKLQNSISYSIGIIIK